MSADECEKLEAEQQRTALPVRRIQCRAIRVSLPPCGSPPFAARQWTAFVAGAGEQAPAETQLTPKASPCARPGLAIRFGAPRDRTRHQRQSRAYRPTRRRPISPGATTTVSDQAKPVARAAFFATRLTLAPVFRTALFADFIAFAVLDFLRFAIFVPLDSRFVQLGSFLHLCQARFGVTEMRRRLNCLSTIVFR